MEFIGDKNIKVEKVITDLDKFMIKFIGILEKYTEYVIVSGYVCILLGRSRGTEDIDIIIPKMEKTLFSKLYKHLQASGFWCLNSSKLNDIVELLDDKHGVRFEVKPQVIPNIELKFSKDEYDDLTLKNHINVLFGDMQLKTSFLELQIAYKECVLKSNKDLEDARHLRLIAKGHLDNNLINGYKKRLR